MMRALLIAVALLTTPAVAQQPEQPMTAEQRLALQIANLSLLNAQLQARIDTMQQQIEELLKRQQAHDTLPVQPEKK